MPNPQTYSVDDAFNGLKQHILDPDPKYDAGRQVMRDIIKQHPKGSLDKAGFLREFKQRKPELFQGFTINGLDTPSGPQTQIGGGVSIPYGPPGSGVQPLPNAVPGQNRIENLPNAVPGQGRVVPLPNATPPKEQLAHQNNNPGNLRFNNQPGATQGAGGYAKFQTTQAGYDALKAQIAIDRSRGLSLDQYISKYAPPNENNTQAYVNQAAQALGVDPSTPLSEIDPDKLAQFQIQKESQSTVTQPPPSATAAKQAPAGPPVPPATGLKGAVGRLGGTILDMGEAAKRPLAEGLRPQAAKIGAAAQGQSQPVQFAAGFAQGIAERGIDMTSVENIGLTAASLLGPGELKASGKLLKYAPSIVRGVFTGGMLEDLKSELGGEYESLVDKGDYVAAGKYAAGALADAYFIRATNKGVPEGEGLLAAGKRALGIGKKTAAPPGAEPSATAEPTGPPARSEAPAKTAAGEARKTFEESQKPKRTKSTAGSTKKAEPNLVERTRAAKAEPTRAEPVEERGPELPKGLAGAKPKYLDHDLDFDEDVDRAAYITAQDRKSKGDADYLKFAMDATGLTEAQVRMRGRQIKGFLGEQSKKQKGEGVINVPKQIDLKAVRQVTKTTPTTAAATSKEPAKLAGKTGVVSRLNDKIQAKSPERAKAGITTPAPAKKEAAPSNESINKVSGLIRQGKLDEAVKRLQKDSNLAPAEARKRVWSAKAALDKRAAAEKPKATPARERGPVVPPVGTARSIPDLIKAGKVQEAQLLQAEQRKATSGSRPEAGSKIPSEIESSVRQILAEDGPEEATKQLRVQMREAGHPEIELPMAREIIKSYTSSSTEPGPPVPAAEVPREQVAARAAEDVIEQAKGGRDEHQFPLYLELQDANGRMISTTAAQTPEMLESVHKHLAEDIAANPEVARVQWKSGKEKGVSFVDKHRRDIIRENQERPAGTFVPNGGSR